MKKAIFFILFVLFQVVIFAQNKLEVGLSGGPNFTILRGNEIIKVHHSYIITYSGGLNFQYELNEIISARTDISFERKGSVYKSGYGTVIYSYFDYLILRIYSAHE